MAVCGNCSICTPPKAANPDLIVKGNNGAYIQMEGREVFKHAVRAMEDAVCGLLEKETDQTKNR